jgi:membrane-bound lytic murein transglycosylase D
MRFCSLAVPPRPSGALAVLALAKVVSVGRARVWLAGVATLITLAGAPRVVRGAVADRRVSAREAAEMAARIEQRSGFPVVVNEHLLEDLNRKVATPASREALRQTLARMSEYRPMMERVLDAKGVPRELLAVALHESKFQREERNSRRAQKRPVGFWQLMPGTARKFGLEVSPARDERFDPQRATEAAAGLLADGYARLGDWPLAITAYKGGLLRIQAAVSGVSRGKARARIKPQYSRYLAHVMAWVILIDNPTLLD